MIEARKPRSGLLGALAEVARDGLVSMAARLSASDGRLHIDEVKLREIVRTEMQAFARDEREREAEKQKSLEDSAIKAASQVESEAWKRVGEEYGRLLLAGVVLSVVLILSATFGPGAKQVLDEFDEHVLYSPPIFWLLTIVAGSFSVMVRGSDSRDVLSKFLIEPIASFVAHIFVVASGAIPILAVNLYFSSGEVHWGVTFLSLLMSVMCGLVAVISLEAARESDLRMTRFARTGAVALFLVSTPMYLHAIQMAGSSQYMLENSVAGISHDLREVFDYLVKSQPGMAVGKASVPPKKVEVPHVTQQVKGASGVASTASSAMNAHRGNAPASAP